MSELRSFIESLRAESLAEVTDAAVEEDFAELHRSMELLEAERLRRLREIERRGIFGRDGHLSCAAWLVDRLGVGWSQARRELRLARALSRMPLTRQALAGQEISMGAARVLAEVQGAHPETFASGEEHLVEAARIHTVGDLGRVAAYWCRRADEQELAGLGERGLREKRGLHASTTFAGMVRVDGDLDAEAGECLLGALGAVLDAEARGRSEEDLRSPAQRRADALGEICRQWLDRSDRPKVGGERPHVVLTVDLQTLEGGTGGGELERVGPVVAHVAERISCDASVRRVLLSGPSEPLDVGRRTQVVPPAMRRAVIVRDRRCRFPGCDRPQAWCDAHHVVHWSRGGPTSLANLVLLCRRHHGLVHGSRGFTVQMVDGQPVFRRPDGSQLEGRAPPSRAA